MGLHENCGFPPLPAGGGGGGGASSWDNLADKPFESIGDGLSVDTDGVLSADGGASAWDDVTGKPFKTVGENLSVDSDGVLSAPLATSSSAGAFKPVVGFYLHNGGAGGVSVNFGSNYEITARSNNTTINMSKLDLAVKAAMTDGIGAAWTDAEKTGAWNRLTSIKSAMDSVAVAGAQYYLGEQSAVDITMPATAEVGQEISVVFYSGSTAATLSVSGDTIGDVPVPAANQRVELNLLWDGDYWAIVSNVLDVPAEETV